MCVCWCACSFCTPPLLAGMCGLGVCAWARVSAAPRHSWLGCWAVCVLVCALRLHPATPGWGARCGGVCLGSGFGCAPPLLAGVLGCACLCACSHCTPLLLAGLRGVGVCAWARVSAAPRHSWRGCSGVRICVRAPLVPRHSWLGCAAWVCVLGLGFRLHPATPGWAVGLCVCSCARSACTLPLLAGMRGVGVCVWARVSAACRHSWLGCWAVCVLVCALGLHPATPGWGARCGCVCLGSGFRCAPPLLAEVLGCACFCACSHCSPLLLAGLRGVGVCAWARVSAAPRHSWLGCSGVRVCVCAPLVPRHSWLGCAVGVCVLGLRFRLHPATPGWGVGLCVCWCRRSACTPSLLAGVRAVGVCVWARVSAAPRHSWLGC